MHADAYSMNSSAEFEHVPNKFPNLARKTSHHCNAIPFYFPSPYIDRQARKGSAIISENNKVKRLQGA